MKIVALMDELESKIWRAFPLFIYDWFPEEVS